MSKRILVFAFSAVLLGIDSCVLAQCGLVNEAGNNTSLTGQSMQPIGQRRVVPYPHVREADIMWARRVWRVIDLRQKFNHPLYFPTQPTDTRSSLYDILVCAIESGQMNAYATGVMGDLDDFSIVLSQSEFQDIILDTTEQMIYDPDLDDYKTVYLPVRVESKDVVKYLVKEEWFFDKQRSVMDVRIVGICPIQETFNEFGEFKGYKRLFWAYFPEMRYTLAHAPVYIRHNDAGNLSYDDLFLKRMFNSYVVKVSNVYDRYINEFAIGLDALAEGESEEEKIFNFEQDMWHY